VEKELDFAEAPLPNYRYATVRRSLQVSVERLAADDENAARRYREVAVFQKARGIPIDPLLALWCATGSLRDRHARKCLQLLERKALLRSDAAWRWLGSSGSILSQTFATSTEETSLHDLQYDFLRSEQVDKPELHRTLLQQYDGLCGRARAKTLGDGYYIDYLVSHLNLAEWRGASRLLESFARSSAAQRVRVIPVLECLVESSDDEIRAGRFLPDVLRLEWDALFVNLAQGGYPLGAANVLGWLATDLWRRSHESLQHSVRKLQSLTALRHSMVAESPALTPPQRFARAGGLPLAPGGDGRVHTRPNRSTAHAPRADGRLSVAVRAPKAERYLYGHQPVALLAPSVSSGGADSQSVWIATVLGAPRHDSQYRDATERHDPVARSGIAGRSRLVCVQHELRRRQVRSLLGSCI
jgi:hypothetical protein